MRSFIEAGLLASILIGGAAAQDQQKVSLTKGVSVQMPVVSHAVEMPAADEPGAKVVAITADGKVFAGTEPVDPAALSNLTEETIYLKADARVSYQKLLSVLDALRGRSLVLLTASPANAERQGITPPYGIRMVVPR